MATYQPLDMDDRFLAGRGRDALVEARGSRARAQRVLMEWPAADPELLRALAVPFLKAIAGHAIQRATEVATAEAAPGAKTRAARVERTLSPEALESVVDHLSRRIPMAPRRGMVETILRRTPEQRPAASQHGTAVRALAEAFLRKQRS